MAYHPCPLVIIMNGKLRRAPNSFSLGHHKEKNLNDPFQLIQSSNLSQTKLDATTCKFLNGATEVRSDTQGKGVKDNKVSGPGGATGCTSQMREKEVGLGSNN